MQGHIQQRGKNSGRIKEYLGGDAAGTKRYVYRTVLGTHRHAERGLSRLLVEVDKGRSVASPAMTLSELLDRWLHVKGLAVARAVGRAIRMRSITVAGTASTAQSAAKVRRSAVVTRTRPEPHGA